MDKTTKIKDFCRLGNSLRISKKGQLGFIEAKFMIMGLVLGIILTIALIFISNKTTLIPAMFGWLCK